MEYVCSNRDETVFARAISSPASSGADRVVHVLKGSTAKGDAYKYAYVSRLKSLLDQGVVVERGGVYEFTRDCEFNSPGAAASFVLGYVASGSRWRGPRGKSLG
jgi:hypothetical protein